jgi:hypothetical protein
LAIRITDKKQPNYYTDTVAENWMKSNPFGYAKWFFNEAIISQEKRLMFSASVNPVPKYQKEKMPLQRVVQILKRHRDMMFSGNEDKPISIIITTLASRAYKKETSIIDALISVATNMRNFIENRYDRNTRKDIKWVSNPVNLEENFADKWIEFPQREKNFYKWLDQVEYDIQSIIQKQGIHNIAEAMKKPFGEQSVIKAFSAYGEKKLNLRQSEALKMAPGTGILSTIGSVAIASHNFHGNG